MIAPRLASFRHLRRHCIRAAHVSDMGEFQKPAGPDQSGNFNGTGTTSSATGKLRANEFFANVRYDF